MINIFINYPYIGKNGRKGVVHLDPVDESFNSLRKGFPAFNDLSIYAACDRWLRYLSIKIFFHHPQNPAQQVPIIIGEIRINSSGKHFLTEIGIRTEDHILNKHIPETSGPVLIHQINRPYNIPQRLAHFCFLNKPPSMGKNSPGKLKTRRF